MPISKIPGKGTQDLFNNISDEGTEGTKVATGTTAQRGSTTGQWRYNTDTGFFEGRNTGGDFSSLEPAPTVTSVDVSEVDSQAGGDLTIVITGTNFASGATASFVGTSASFDASTTTVNSSNQITATATRASFLNAQEPYKVKVASASGIAGTSSTGLINVDTAPTWTTSAGSLGSILESATGNHFTVAATDADGETIAYSLESGSLGGLSLNSSTGVISGDPTDVSADTTNNFTLRATANNKTADRAFSYITLNPDGSTQAKAVQYGSEVVSALGGSFSAGLYWLTGKSSLGLSAQQVYVDSDGYMLVYRHAGTGGSFNVTYEIQGNSLGEDAIGTLTSPTMGLTTTGVSTTAGSRGVARLSAQFCNALGGDSASGQVTRMTVNNTTHYITDAKIWWTADSGDGYGVENISAGTSYSGRRDYSGSPDQNRPIGTYDLINNTGLIPFFHNSNYSGGYDGGSWHHATTIWVRQY